MAPFFIEKSFCVAVSGGADSMALALLAQRFAVKYNLSMTALTVDHGLRKNSADEALWVNTVLTFYGIKHQTLVWNHDVVPDTKIQEKARIARYDLLVNWCQDNNVDTLLTAHHQGDVIETFFIRLAHQSGLKGLSSIKATLTMPFGVLLRPFLTIPKERLVKTLEQLGCKWIEDPSNDNDAYERIRFRKMLTQLYGQNILSPDALGTSINKLKEIDAYLDAHAMAFFRENTVNCFSLAAFQQQHRVMQQRILAHVIRERGMPGYPPSDLLIARTCDALMKNDFKGVTLSGLYFRRSAGGLVRVSQEKRRRLIAKI